MESSSEAVFHYEIQNDNEELVNEPLSEDLCRICATNNQYMTTIFEGEGLENDLGEKINSLLPITVSKDDEFTHFICYQCASHIISWYDLRKCAINTDIKFRNSLKLRNEGAKNNQESSLNETVMQMEPVDVNTDEEEESKENANSEEGSFRHNFNNLGKQISGQNIESKPRHARFSPSVKLGCRYCEGLVFHTKDDQSNHFINWHANFVFHCDVCDNYVDRKELVPHMSLHASQSKENFNNNDSVPTRNLSPKSRTQKASLQCDVQHLVNSATNSQNIRQSKSNSTGKCISKTCDSNTMTIPNTDSATLKSRLEPNNTENITPYKDLITNAEQNSPLGIVLRKVETAKQVSRSRVRGLSKIKTFFCKSCEKKFTNYSSLYYHLKHVHKGIKNYKCNVCKKAFALKGAMVEHIRIHTGETPYKCSTCSKCFKSRSSLGMHIKIHSDDFKFTCSFKCGKKFRTKQQMKKHVARHEGKNNYSCSVCKRAFNVKNDLTRHEKIHSDTQSYKCEVCGFLFAQKRYLTDHIKKQHLQEK